MAVPPEVADHRMRFLEAMDDDFNTGGALGELFEVARALNRHADQNRLEAGATTRPRGRPSPTGTARAEGTGQILGLFRTPPKRAATPRDQLTGPLVELLIRLRAQLRKEKNFALADQVRNELGGLGVVLEDRAEGTTWKIEAK